MRNKLLSCWTIFTVFTILFIMVSIGGVSALHRDACAHYLYGKAQSGNYEICGTVKNEGSDSITVDIYLRRNTVNELQKRSGVTIPSGGEEKIIAFEDDYDYYHATNYLLFVFCPNDENGRNNALFAYGPFSIIGFAVSQTHGTVGGGGGSGGANAYSWAYRGFCT